MTKPARKELTIALVGQPNCGKSTLFNAVAGFQVDTGNFAGTSVTYTETSLCFEGRAIRLIDLPGTYSISSLDPAERVTRNFLLSGEVDVIVDVVDSSLLSRSLELTLQLIEMKVPMVICLNMMDEAHRKGIEIDERRLSELTGISVRPVVAVLGTGIEEVFRAALALNPEEYRPILPLYDRDVEECIAGIARHSSPGLRNAVPLPERFVLLRLLEMDAEFEQRVQQADSTLADLVRRERKRLAEMHAWPETGVLASHRHALVLDLYEKIATHHHGTAMIGLREQIDGFLTTPLGGLLTVIGSVLLTFFAAFSLGDAIAGKIEGLFHSLRAFIEGFEPSLWSAMLSGFAEGLVAGAGIVLPYLLPLLLLLAIYEDTGLLPRFAFMVDGILHRVGLHGKSVIPLLLGFGCSVPAIMSTRNLENPRDRFITMLVAPFIPCSARSVIILALAGKYLGPVWVALFYLLGIAVAMTVSLGISRSDGQPSLGLIMEVPPLRRPFPTIIARKVWFRLQEFFVVAWPVILISSIVLSALTHFGIDAPVNRALSPLTTTVLRLPEATGIALFLGLFRKELTLAMLGTALGTTELGAVLSHGQIIVLVVFTMLYIPCIASLAALWKEGGWKICLGSALLNFGVAVAVAGLVAHLVR